MTRCTIRKSARLFVVVGLLAGGCEWNGSATNGGGGARVSGSQARQSSYHARTADPEGVNAPSYREGATPSGLSGSDVYDQPGALPANGAGGTNGGRAGLDEGRTQ